MLSSFSRSDHRREAPSVPWHPSRWRRPTHAGLAAKRSALPFRCERQPVVCSTMPPLVDHRASAEAAA